MAVNPNIKKKADDIRNKVYGKEVRESLASGLEAMSTDVVENEGRQSVVEGRQDSVESQFQDVIDNTTDKDVISAPEIIAARDGEVNLKARLDKGSAQLAQTEDKVKRHTNSGTKKSGATVVFTFDDGYVEDLTVMKPLFDEYGYKATTYIITGRFGGKELHYDLMTVEQIKELELGGWEIGAHTVNHVRLGSVSKDVAKAEIIESKKTLENLGFKVDNFAYPYGEMNDYARYQTLNNFRSAVNFDSTSEVTLPIENENIPRISLGSYFARANDEFPITDDFENYYKYWVDKAIEKDTLVVFALHSAPMLAIDGQLDELRQTLDYCRDNNVKVTTLNEALDFYENRLYLKSVDKEYAPIRTFTVDAESNLTGKDYTFIKEIPKGNIDSNTSPEFFDKETLSIVSFHGDGVTKGFPFAYARLHTHKLKYSDDVRQTLVEKWTNRVKIRSSNQLYEWSDWSDVGGGGVNILKSADVDSNTPPAFFQYEKETIIDFHGNGTAKGFPFNNAKLYTYRHTQYNDDVRQTIVAKWSNKKMVRFSKADGTWSDWSAYPVRFNKAAFKPLTSDTVLKAQSQLIFEVEDSDLGMNNIEAVVIASPRAPLPTGLVYHVWSDTINIRLVLYNATQNDITLSANNTLFNIKAIHE